MLKQINKASDNNGFNVDGPICTSSAQFRIENKQEFSFLDFALNEVKSPFPLNFSYKPCLEVTKVRSTKRGSGRKEQFLFFKELVSSNSQKQTWDVDKSISNQTLPEVEEENEFEETPMVNLKDYLTALKEPKAFRIKKKKSFTRANVEYPHYKPSVSTQQHQVDQENSVTLPRTHQHNAVNNKTSTMASHSIKNVPASGVASEIAATSAFQIPMLTMEAFNINNELLKAANLTTGLASISHKFVSVNVLQAEEYAFKQFCVDQGLTIINSYTLRIFVPTLIDKIQFVVTRKGRAPIPPSAVEHGEETVSVPEVAVEIEVITTESTPQVVKKNISPTEKSVKINRPRGRPRNNRGPITSMVSQKATRAIPYKGKVDHSILQQWEDLTPEQVLVAREAQLSKSAKHRDEVLASKVEENKSFADCLEGINKVITTFTYLQMQPKENNDRLKGIPHKVWATIGTNQDKVRAYYKQLFRTTFYTLRTRWLKIQQENEDMNPYLTDFSYFWRQINAADLSKVFDNIKNWEKKVIAFYPKTATACEWYKQTKDD